MHCQWGRKPSNCPFPLGAGDQGITAENMKTSQHTDFIPLAPRKSFDILALYKSDYYYYYYYYQ